ncbi:NADH dehydrogenase domain-containing protein [Desulfonema limicola]|uniref:NADH dehydrogenase domain-containing protein n=1 Tax=Desulfonema limicola TaxID=45656 RepID=A0A975B9N7_9BACT|nr:NAD(P)-dependent oxidoreductase [Desulfonema limicola]QTA81338.1 NADH dehydrogenase domain-containing protein [Desulfonema limicola]
MKHNILITGVSGYLGSVLCAELSQYHNVTGLYRRSPSARQRHASPGVVWEKGELADIDCIELIFRRSILRGQKIDYVIHFAAYTDYNEKWQDEYCTTNVIGTRNIIETASRAGVKRILFAGSIAALEPLPRGQVLTEKSPAGGSVAYSRSKAIGEKMLIENSHRVPVAVLRIGGVFTDWCELPPLFSLINMWSQPFTGCMIPGRGFSGFPYIHRKDLVRAVTRVIEKNESLEQFDTFFASHNGCTYQKDLFPVIRSYCNEHFSIKPLNVPRFFAKMALHGKYIFNTIRKKPTYERAWMIKYVDRPLVVDTGYTRNKLDWEPDPDWHILKRLPVLMNNFNKNRQAWYNRNVLRNDQKYEYEPDCP